ncbi:MAG: peroxiredoxin family protein [Pirellulales bacterium]
MRKSYLSISLIVAFVATIGCPESEETGMATVPASTSMPKTYTVTGGPAIGELAPEIEGTDLDGVAFKLSDYRGKVVMLDFYGDW